MMLWAHSHRNTHTVLYKRTNTQTETKCVLTTAGHVGFIVMKSYYCRGPLVDSHRAFIIDIYNACQKRKAGARVEPESRGVVKGNKVRLRRGSGDLVRRKVTWLHKRMQCSPSSAEKLQPAFKERKKDTFIQVQYPHWAVTVCVLKLSQLFLSTFFSCIMRFVVFNIRHGKAKYNF